MTACRWPYPEDGPLAVRERVAHAYRAVAEQYAPHACAELDRRMVGWAQRWVVPQEATWELGDWLSAKEAADAAQITVGALQRRRLRKTLTGKLIGGKWFYLAADVVKWRGDE